MLKTHPSFPIYGESPALQEVMRAAELVSYTSASVLIIGETGTGKELLARAIHHNGNRNQKPFVTLNCAMLTEENADAILFGLNEEGAEEANNGYIASAQGGTLLLDEVSELPLSIQPKLLRFLESGELKPPQVENRRLLRQVMRRAGFRGLKNEWWHFEACDKRTARARYAIVEDFSRQQID